MKPVKFVKRHGLVAGRVNDELVENRLCEYLADWGFSVAAIMDQTSKTGRQLTACQISYRMRRKSQKLTNYRNGSSDAADSVIAGFDSIMSGHKKKRA